MRVLADGTNLAQYQRYYLASTPFAQARPDVIKVIHDALTETGKWVKQSPKDAAALLAPVWGLDEATVEQANGRRSYDVRLVQPERLQEQQVPVMFVVVGKALEQARPRSGQLPMNEVVIYNRFE